MSEGIEAIGKKKKRRRGAQSAYTPQFFAPQAPAAKPTKDAKSVDAPKKRKNPGAADSVKYANGPANVFADGAGQKPDTPKLSPQTETFLANGGDKLLADAKISREDFDKWITTGEESASIKAAREKMQAAKTNIQAEMRFFQKALPVYAKAAEARGDTEAADGARALQKKIGTYEAQAYRLWIDSTKANIKALRGMAAKARAEAKDAWSSGDSDKARALEKKADDFEDAAAKQSKTITGTLVVRKEAVKAQIEKSDRYDQRQRSQHTAYSDEIAELRNGDGLAEADAMERSAKRQKDAGYDVIAPDHIPDALGDAKPNKHFAGGAQYYLSEAEKYDLKANDDAGHLNAKRNNGRARNDVATRYLAIKGYPPKKGETVKASPSMKGLMRHKVDGLITERAAAEKRVADLEKKTNLTPNEEKELNRLRKDVMDLSTRLESLKQELSAHQGGPEKQAKLKKRLEDDANAAERAASAADQAVSDHDKKYAEEKKYEHSDPTRWADYEAMGKTLRAERDVAKQNARDARAAYNRFDLETAGSNAPAMKEIANAGAGVIVESFGPREPPGNSTDMSVIAGGGYKLDQYGPSTDEVLAPGVEAAEKLDEKSFDDAEAAAGFYTKATKLSKKGDKPTPASKKMAKRAVESVGHMQTTLDGTKAGSAEQKSMAKRTVQMGVGVAVATTNEDPAAARGLLKKADGNVDMMAVEDQAEGHVVVSEGVAAHAKKVARRVPPPKDKAYDEAIALGKELIGKGGAPKDRKLADRQKRAEESFESTKALPKKLEELLEKRRDAAKRAKEHALAKTRWYTREGKDIAEGAISYLSFPVEYYLDAKSGDVLKDREKMIEDGFKREMARIDGLEELARKAEAKGHWGELMGAFAAGDTKAIGDIAKDSGYSGRPPVADVARFVNDDKTALGSSLSGGRANLDRRGAAKALDRQTAPTNSSAERAVGEAQTHLEAMHDDAYFAYVPLAVAAGETAVEMIATAGLSTKLSAVKFSAKLASVANKLRQTQRGAKMVARAVSVGRALQNSQRAQRVGNAILRTYKAHRYATEASVAYAFTMNAAKGYAVMQGQKALIGELQGKIFAKGSAGEKWMNAGVGLAGDLGGNHIYKLSDLGKNMVMPGIQTLATHGVVPYMTRNGGWSQADAEKFTTFVELGTVGAGAAHGVHAQRKARIFDPTKPKPTAADVQAAYDQRVTDLAAKHPDMPSDVIRARAHKEVSDGLNVFASTGKAKVGDLQTELAANVSRDASAAHAAQRTGVDTPAEKATVRNLVDASYDALGEGGSKSKLAAATKKAHAELKADLMRKGMNEKAADKRATEIVDKTLDTVAKRQAHAKIMIASDGAMPPEAMRAVYQKHLEGLGFETKKAADLATKHYAAEKAVQLTNAAGLSPAQAAAAQPKIRAALEANHGHPDKLRAAIERSLGKLETADGKPLLSAEQSAQIAKTAVIEATGTEALRQATNGTFEIESPAQLEKVVAHQREALLSANEGRVPPMFSDADLKDVAAATVDGYIRRKAAAMPAKSAFDAVGNVRKQAETLKKDFGDVDVEKTAAGAAMDIALSELGSTDGGKKMLADPKQASKVDKIVRARAMELGAKPEAIDAVAADRKATSKTADDPSKWSGPDSISMLVKKPDGRFEEHAGYHLLGVDEANKSATVRGPDGRVKDVHLDDVVFEHNGVTFGAPTPLEMQRFRANHDALSPADQQRWSELMGQARAKSREHAALMRRMLASGESIDACCDKFEQVKDISKKDLVEHFSMDGHTQHFSDSCAVAGGCQAPLGWVSPRMGEAITKYPQAVAAQQRKRMAEAEGSSEPRTDDMYRGKANLDPNAYIPASPGSADADAKAAYQNADPGMAATYNMHDASRLDANHAPDQIHDIIDRGGDAWVTLRLPGSNQDLAVRLSDVQDGPNGKTVAVTGPDIQATRMKLETRYATNGQPYVALDGVAVGSVAVPRSEAMRGTRRGMYFTMGTGVVNDLERTTGKTYERRSVRELDDAGEVVPDAQRSREVVDQTEALAKAGFPVMLEVQWEDGGAHQIAVKPGTRKNKNGETEMFVYDPWLTRGRWMTKNELEAYKLGSQNGKIVAMGVPDDTPRLGNQDVPEAHSDTIPPPPPAGRRRPTKTPAPANVKPTPAVPTPPKADPYAVRNTVGWTGTPTKTPAPGKEHLGVIHAGIDKMSAARRERIDALLERASTGAPRLTAERERLGAELQKVYADHGAELAKGTNPALQKQVDGLNEKIANVDRKLEASKRDARKLAVQEMAAFRQSLLRKNTPANAAANARIPATPKAQREASEAKLQGWAKDFYMLHGKKVGVKRFVRTNFVRGSANPNGELNVGKNPTKKRVFHELGHYAEYADPKLKAAAQAWVKARSAHAHGEARTEKLSELTGSDVYSADEVAFEDHFDNPYVGKKYADGTTEVLSTGMEHMTSADDMLKLYQRDPEHFFFVVGALK